MQAGGGGGDGGSTGPLTPLMSSQLVYGDGVDDIKVNTDCDIS